MIIVFQSHGKSDNSNGQTKKVIYDFLQIKRTLWNQSIQEGMRQSLLIFQKENKNKIKQVWN